VLRDQPVLFGPVASTATAWRVLDKIDPAMLNRLRAARALAREQLWAQRSETVGLVGAHRAGGRVWPGLRIMFDATLVTAHSEKESAAPNFKGGYGFHPLTAWLDNTGEALAAVLRPGNAGSNTASDHIAVTDLALAQIPDQYRHGVPILVSADGAGATRAWLAHLRAQRQTGVDLEFSVGFTMTTGVQAAILALPEQVWTAAINADGSLREGADVAELTGMLGDLTVAGWPSGMRVIVRRERPHPGAQLSFTDIDGCASKRSPPTPGSGSWPTSRRVTGRMPGSRTGSAAPRTPAWAGCPRGSSRSTRPGSSSP
jgi:Transposase DDE domain group 1